MNEEPKPAKRSKTKDFCVRQAVVRQLISEGIPREHIRHEITLDTNSSGGRADMIILMNHAICGIEIKSESDTTSRLEAQLDAYGQAFDRIGIVADKKHHDENGPYRRTHSVFHCGEVNGFVHRYRGEWLPYDKEPFLYRDLLPYDTGRTWVGAMASLLWKEEIDRVCFALRINGGARYEGIKAIKEHACMNELRPQVIQQLRQRELNKWEQDFWGKYDAA